MMGIEETVTPAQMLAMFDVNVAGPQRVARAVLPSMRARGKGLLVGVSSSIARVTFPLMGAYCASKAALETLFEGYRMELKPTGVESTLVQPGAYATGLGERIVIGAEQERAAGYGPLANAMQEMGAAMAQMTTGPNAPSPQLVADAIVALVESPAGTRPAHVIVDMAIGPMVDAINKAHADETKKVLSNFGMGMLCD
jgi:NAD(P)-dependent dehydrogenase (short-subunit alcohol dehydrogenase family)